MSSQFFECFRGEPAALFIVHEAQRFLSLQNFAVVIEYGFEGAVDLFRGEEGPPVLCLHKLNKDAVERKPHQLAV